MRGRRKEVFVADAKPAPQRGCDWGLLSGFLLTSVVNALVAIVGFALALAAFDLRHRSGLFDIGWLVFSRIGVVQLIYVIPIAIWGGRKASFVKGGILAASLTALINAAFWVRGMSEP